MWRNYLTVGIRALAKNRTYAFINIFGLAIGMAACLMILLYVRYETSFDRWLPDAENVYAIHTSAATQGQERRHFQMAPFPTAAAIKKDFPEVEASTSVLQARPVVRRGAESLFVDNTLVADAAFFDVLRLPFVAGDPATALRDAGSVILSEAEAKRLLGSTDAVGKTLTIVQRGQERDYRVTGVMRDIPRDSSLKISMVLRIDPADYADSQVLDSWGSFSGYGWARLRPGSDAAALNARMPEFERRNMPPQDVGNGARISTADFIDLSFVNIRDVHLARAQAAGMTPGNDLRTVATFAVVALLILGMACVNFTNLATARASQRAREVALRKVLGARRSQLIAQFLGESVLVAALAMLLGLAITEISLPFLSRFLDAKLVLSYLGAEGVLPVVLLLVLLVGMAGGLYPAFYLSRFQPARVLKANKSAADHEGSGRLRNILVVAQFAVSIGLIICTAIVYAQTDYARQSDPGYRRDGLLIVEGLNRRQISPATAETLARQAAALPGVEGATRTSLVPAQQDTNNTAFQVPGRPDPELIGFYQIDPAYLKTMELALLAGRNLSDNVALDRLDLSLGTDPVAERALVARGANMLLNESASRKLGFARPAEAIGKTLPVGIVNPENGGMVPATVVGVVADAQFRSMRETIEPMSFFYSPLGMSRLVVRYSDSDPAAVRARLERLWRSLIPDVPFQAEFADDAVAELYAADLARGQIFAVFAGLSVIVGCLGLFGLAAFTAERRTKEIGIRKVLGARTRDIVQLLVWQFSKPVVAANLIAWPVAWWAMRDWLNGFSDRIDLGPGPFLLAGLLALAIAIGTIAGHALKVARANPIHALRYE